MNEAKQGAITREVRGHSILLGIDRQTKLNAFTWHMLTDLAEAYTEYEQDPELRCAVLFAHGDHFTAGLDLADIVPRLMKGESFVPPGKVDPWGIYGRVRSKPLVMAIQGRCLTLGIELALSSDINIASSDTRFAQIEVKRGLFPFGGATIRFPRVAGWNNAMRYLLTGDEFNASEAFRIGLVQEVVEPGWQLARALELADKIAAQAPLGVQATIASARVATDLTHESAFKELLPEAKKLFQTEDAKEGFRSLLERRSGKFQGK